MNDTWIADYLGKMGHFDAPQPLRTIYRNRAKLFHAQGPSAYVRWNIGLAQYDRVPKSHPLILKTRKSMSKKWTY